MTTLEQITGRRSLTTTEVRGLGRGYARRGYGAGAGYRTMCRWASEAGYFVPRGGWSMFLDGYDDERAVLAAG